MKICDLAKYALIFTMGAAAMLAACSNNGGSFFAPSGASSGMPGIAHIVVRSQPTKRKRNGPYQYISDFGNSTVLEFDYPKGDASIGSIGGVSSAEGECTNVLFGSGKKTFWVTSSVSAPGAIDEFKVGGTTPISTLNTPTGDVPVGCAMDTTGDLAATSINSAQVDVFKGAKGRATQLTTPLNGALFPGYDTKGNLYVDGFNGSGLPAVVELKKGSKKWKTLSLSNSVSFPGSVQFDGKYITVDDQLAHAIYGYTCSGTSCTLKRTVSLSGGCSGTWIAKGYVICVNGVAEIYKYPAGGYPIAHLGTSFSALVAPVQVEK